MREPGIPIYPHSDDTQYGMIGSNLGLDYAKVALVWLITNDGIEPFDWDVIRNRSCAEQVYLGLQSRREQTGSREPTYARPPRH